MGLNLKLVQIGRKAPPLFCLLVRYLAHVVVHVSLNLTLVTTWQKSSPPRLREKFLHWICPFQRISGNFGFCGRKAPPPNQDEGNFFYTGSIHFRQFQATLLFVAEKYPSQAEGNYFFDWIYPFQTILSNFGFCGRKAPRLGWGEHFLHWIYPFQTISCNFGFCGRKTPHLFCLFIRDQACVTQVEYPRSQYYKSALRFLLSEYLV